METLILEACVESFAQAKSAQKKGAHQIELCDRLDLGGTTPPYALIRRAKAELHINTKVMIRPRGGDFHYSLEEFEQMKTDIQFCKSIHIYGVVFGILTREQALDIQRIKILADLAAPMQVTIHRAIDETPDPLAAVRQLRHLANVHCILSSGQADTARAGAGTLRKMAETAAPKLTIIPAGKITAENLRELHKLVGSTTYHGTKIVGPL
jgi:copper homeostasis protein